MWKEWAKFKYANLSVQDGKWYPLEGTELYLHLPLQFWDATTAYYPKVCYTLHVNAEYIILCITSKMFQTKFKADLNLLLQNWNFSAPFKPNKMMWDCDIVIVR